MKMCQEVLLLSESKTKKATRSLSRHRRSILLTGFHVFQSDCFQEELLFLAEPSSNSDR